jgi:hypothetical protein
VPPVERRQIEFGSGRMPDHENAPRHLLPAALEKSGKWFSRSKSGEIRNHQFTE